MARDYKAEYRARVAKGAARGLRPSDAAGQSKRSKASTARVPRDSTIRKGNRVVQVIQSSDRRYVQQQIARAAARDKNVQIYAVWQTDLGYGTQAAGTGQGKHASTRTGDRAHGKFRVLIATKDTMRALTGVTGVRAVKVLADLLKRDPETGARVFDTFDDYLADWWDDEEGEYGTGSSAPPAAPDPNLTTSTHLGDF